MWVTQIADALPAWSVALAVNARIPVGTPVNVFDHVPLLAATVPREVPFSKTSRVDPGSAVPDNVNDDPVLVIGVVITGAAGAIVSTLITRGPEAEEPPSVRAFAVNRYAPSAGTVTVLLHVPDSEAVAVPNEIAPSNISAVAPG